MDIDSSKNYWLHNIFQGFLCILTELTNKYIIIQVCTNQVYHIMSSSSENTEHQII